MATGTDENRQTKLYIQDVAGGEPKSLGIKVNRTGSKVISPDGESIIAPSPEGVYFIIQLDNGNSRPLIGIEAGEQLVQFSQDGSHLFVFYPAKLPARVFKLNVATGQRQLLKEIMPPDPIGITTVDFVRFSADEKSYAYSYGRNLSTLYVIDGLK